MIQLATLAYTWSHEWPLGACYSTSFTVRRDGFVSWREELEPTRWYVIGHLSDTVIAIATRDAFDWRIGAAL